MPLRPARYALAAVALAAAVVVSGCGSVAAGADGVLSVVTSTNVYGDLAATVGGDAVTVTSFLDGTGQDPHSYEASAHDELALAKADVVIENGGGYDDFMGELLHAAGGSATVLDAVRLSGHTESASGELNEHVWYDLRSVQRVVTRLVGVLSAADPGGAAGFAARAGKLSAGLRALERAEAQLRNRYAGTGVAITEALPLYLLGACGLVDRTPPEFSAAVEEGTGVPASALNDTLHLFSGHDVRALVYNAQESGPETDKVVAAAKDAGVATVPVTETLPSGQTYLTWMRGNLSALARALR
jgi:zinc/manganese transport system substrate-binding protein